MKGYNAETTDGATVRIVSKRIVDASRPHETLVLTDDKGRDYRPLPGLKVEQITVMEVAEADEATTEDEPNSLVDEVTETVDDLTEAAGE